MFVAWFVLPYRLLLMVMLFYVFVIIKFVSELVQWFLIQCSVVMYMTTHRFAVLVVGEHYWCFG